MNNVIIRYIKLIVIKLKYIVKNNINTSFFDGYHLYYDGGSKCQRIVRIA